MKKIIILGAGLVGRAIAADLKKSFDVTSADINEENLKNLKNKYSIKTEPFDFNNEEKLKSKIKNFDLVVCAVPGFMGFKTLKQIISAGKDVVDISFFDEDPFELDRLAKEKNVTAVVDCGVAPGMSNIILGYYNNLMKVESFECYVGGLPFERIMPFQYKAAFSPVDVIEEYMRPARLIENNKVIVKDAMTDNELIKFERAGALEAFNTDGLRSLLKTMNIPNMKEKTLRYPGHIDYMKFLKEAGFFDNIEIEINGNKIKPIEMTSKLLFPKWKLGENEREFTVMKIIIIGEKRKIIYNLFDEYDIENEVTSMARTTGYTCAAAANLVISKMFMQKGINPPEYIGKDKICFEFILKYLNERNIILRKEEESI